MRFRPWYHGLFLVLFSSLCVASQNTPIVPSHSAANLQSTPKGEEPPKATNTQAAPDDYVLGPDDQISIWVADCPDISAKPFNIDTTGYINLPFVGVVRAAGLTARQLESQLTSDLKLYFVRPEVTVSIVEFRSEPVSVIGAVNQPGVHQLRGHKTLVEVLSLAGGIRSDAGYRVKITRESQWGTIPLPDARTDLSGKFSVAEVKLNSILNATSPEDNILIRPHDVISVPRGQLVYVIGEVTKPGGFVLSENQTITILRVLSLAGGLNAQAAGHNARILREADDGAEKTEVAVDVKKILAGKAQDVPLRADDILFIPDSLPKKAGVRIAEMAIQTATGLAIYRH